MQSEVIQTAVAPFPEVPLKTVMARALLHALATETSAYCLLSGYDRMPDDFDSDIDFMVSCEDFAKIPSLVANVAEKNAMSLCLSVDHEVTGRALFLMSVSGASLTIVQPDCASDFVHFGNRWLTAEDVLSKRRQDVRGFWIPSAGHEFAYLLIKRLNKSKFTREDGSRLHRLFSEDGTGSERVLARLFRQADAKAIAGMAASNNWSPMLDSLPAFREALMSNRRTPVMEKVMDLPCHLQATIKRIIHPTGLWVAFMGPDGCGKSTILPRVAEELAPAFRRVDTYHMRPRLIGRRRSHQGPVVDPHGRPPRRLTASVIKLLDLMLDYALGYVAKLRPALIRTTLVVFDRCFQDLLVDSLRIRYGGPRWLLTLVARILPRPDLIILLDAPAEVLWQRKQEVACEEVARQRLAYLDIAHALDRAVIINAAQPVDAVVHDALVAVTRYLAKRTANRLNLAAPPDVLPSHSAARVRR